MNQRLNNTNIQNQHNEKHDNTDNRNDDYGSGDDTHDDGDGKTYTDNKEHPTPLTQP